MTLIALSGCASESCDKEVVNILNPNQTSVKLLMDYAKTAVCKIDPSGTSKPGTVDEECKLVLIYDLLVTARSYAMLNKVFLWPALGARKYSRVF